MFKRSIILMINVPSVEAKVEELSTLETLLHNSFMLDGSSKTGVENTLINLGNFSISGKLSDGTDRPALNIGTSANTQPLYIPEGKDYEPSTSQDHRHMYITGSKGEIDGVVITLSLN